MLHACRNTLFHCLLFNSSLNSPKFKFELNMFESISKENAKPFSLSPSLFSPAGPIPLSPFPSLSHFFPLFPAAQNTSTRRPTPFPRPNPASHPFLSSLPPTGGAHQSGPSPSPCSSRTLVEFARQGPPPAYKRRHPVHLEPYRASAAAQPAQNPNVAAFDEPELGAPRGAVAPPCPRRA